MTMSTGRKLKLLAGLKIPSNSTVWVKLLSAGWVAVDISSAAAVAGRRSFFVLGDGTSADLLGFLTTLISTETVSQGGDGSFEMSLLTDESQGLGGIVRVFEAEGDTSMQLAWTDPTGGGSSASSTWIRDWLRLDATGASTYTIIDNVPRYGFRSHAGGVYPSYLEMEDLDELEVRGSQAVPDQGSPFSLKLAERRIHKLGLRLGSALPRDSSYNEWHQLDDLMQFASQGLVLRHYPDRDVTTVFSEVSNPYGFREYALHRDSWNWRPAPAYGNWYRQFSTDLRLHTAVST